MGSSLKTPFPSRKKPGGDICGHGIHHVHFPSTSPNFLLPIFLLPISPDITPPPPPYQLLPLPWLPSPLCTTIMGNRCLLEALCGYHHLALYYVITLQKIKQTFFSLILFYCTHFVLWRNIPDCMNSMLTRSLDFLKFEIHGLALCGILKPNVAVFLLVKSFWIVKKTVVNCCTILTKCHTHGWIHYWPFTIFLSIGYQVRWWPKFLALKPHNAYSRPVDLAYCTRFFGVRKLPNLCSCHAKKSMLDVSRK